MPISVLTSSTLKPTGMRVVDPKLAIGVGGKLNKVEHCTTHLNLAEKSMRNKLWFCEENVIKCKY